jgi:predicted metallo-beta-lactamase superfamily hydrolase
VIQRVHLGNEESLKNSLFNIVVVIVALLYLVSFAMFEKNLSTSITIITYATIALVAATILDFFVVRDDNNTKFFRKKAFILAGIIIGAMVVVAGLKLKDIFRSLSGLIIIAITIYYMKRD